ncbi:CvpA family protein [Eubacteriaceae bacterium ES2]|nr:CvpA family protein [Eubacteriaceae bacterium ES2]
MTSLTAMDWLCLILCLGFALTGFRRGAINSLIRFGGFIASFIIGIIFSPVLADYLIESGIMAEIYKSLNLEALSGVLLSLTEQNQALNTFLSNGELLPGAQETIESAIIYGLAHFISFGAILLACSLILVIVQLFFKGFTALPVIGGIDSLLGLVLGLSTALVIAFLIVWVFIMIDLYASQPANLLNYQMSIFYQKIAILFLPI